MSLLRQFLLFLAAGFFWGVALGVGARALFGLSDVVAFGVTVPLTMAAVMALWWRFMLPAPFSVQARVATVPPDFFIADGTGPHDLLKTRRACWKGDLVTARDGTRVQLYTISPSITEEPPLPAEVLRDTIGIFQQVKMSVITGEGVTPMPSGKADFWVIADIEGNIVPLGCIGTVSVEAG